MPRTSLAPAIPATLVDLQAELEAVLVAGGDTRPIRAGIAAIEATQAARVVADEQAQRAAAAALAESAEVAAAARVATSRAALAARLAALAPPPHPFQGPV